MADGFYSETRPDLWTLVAMVSAMSLVVLITFTAVRLRRTGAKFRLAITGVSLAMLIAAGWLLLLTPQASVTGHEQSVTCDPPLEAASLHGVPSDEFMSPSDAACRAAGQRRVALCAAAGVVIAGINLVALREVRRRQGVGRSKPSMLPDP